VGIGKLNPGLLARFGGGVERGKADATAAAKPASASKEERPVPQVLKGLSRSAPEHLADANDREAGARVGGSRTGEKPRNRPECREFSNRELVGLRKELSWSTPPNTEAALKRQLSHPRAGAKEQLRSLPDSKRPKTGVEPGRTAPIAQKKKSVFGRVVSDPVLGGHREVPPESNANREVIFEKLLALQPTYEGENIRYVKNPSDYKIRINEAGLLVDSSRNPITATDAKFVVNEYGDWYMAKFYRNEIFHHSSLLQGKPVAMAGFMSVQDGVLQTYDDDSGHYQPKAEHIEQFERYLQSKNVRQIQPGHSFVPREMKTVRVGKPSSPMVYGDVPSSPMVYGDVPGMEPQSQPHAKEVYANHPDAASDPGAVNATRQWSPGRMPTEYANIPPLFRK
jgi:hypothetical protein